VAAVYRELLKTYKAQNIGIFGCSAGGTLTAESLAWFKSHQLPQPGAVGIFSAGASVESSVGDSFYTGTLLSGDTLDPMEPSRHTLPDYFREADPQNPLVSPLYSAATLAWFPPTLMITSTRDAELSSVIYTHTQLVKAGVHADLHVWEGMRHCFFYWPQPPESKEAWSVIVRFFDAHLGKG
jgi:epsilon-lactone hydrolase